MVIFNSYVKSPEGSHGDIILEVCSQKAARDLNDACGNDLQLVRHSCIHYIHLKNTSQHSRYLIEILEPPLTF